MAVIEVVLPVVGVIADARHAFWQAITVLCRLMIQTFERMVCQNAHTSSYCVQRPILKTQCKSHSRSPELLVWKNVQGMVTVKCEKEAVNDDYQGCY